MTPLWRARVRRARDRRARVPAGLWPAGLCPTLGQTDGLCGLTPNLNQPTHVRDGDFLGGRQIPEANVWG